MEESILHLRHPVLWGLFVGVTGICMALVFWYAPDEWSLVRKALAGVFAGAWSFFCLFINRLLVA